MSQSPASQPETPAPSLSSHLAEQHPEVERPSIGGEALMTPSELARQHALAHRSERQVDWQGRVALAMALMLGIALVLFTGAVLYDAVASQGPGLSSNATQVLTAAFSSMIGALSVWLGSRRNTGD